MGERKRQEDGNTAENRMERTDDFGSTKEKSRDLMGHSILNKNGNGNSQKKREEEDQKRGLERSR